jgi:hypothetical protein
MTSDRPDDANDAVARQQTIDAFLDGEVVDAHALRGVLDEPSARDYLIDALRLRQLTRELEPERFAGPGTTARPLVRRIRWLAAGVLLAISAGAGYAYGQGGRTDAPESVVIAIDGRAAPPPPAPTRHIRFEPGVNWTSETRSR